MENTRTDPAEDRRSFRISETLTVSILLTVTGGFLDAYTYLFRGKVFANGQTGNFVLLGVSLVEQDFQRALYYLLPITAFLLGVFLAESIHARIGNDRFIKWRHVVLLLEIAILLMAVFIPQGEWDYLANISISFVCALQTQAFRSLRGLSYISVMCTGNVRSGIHEFCNYLHSRQKKYMINGFYYFLIVLSFVFGAALGTFFMEHWHYLSLLFPIGLLSIALLLLFAKKHLRSLSEKL